MEVPKYTQKDIATMIKMKRGEYKKSLKEASLMLQIPKKRLERIEMGKAILITKETISIANFLGISFEELTTVYTKD